MVSEGMGGNASGPDIATCVHHECHTSTDCCDRQRVRLRAAGDPADRSGPSGVGHAVHVLNFDEGGTESGSGSVRIDLDEAMSVRRFAPEQRQMFAALQRHVQEQLKHQRELVVRINNAPVAEGHRRHHVQELPWLACPDPVGDVPANDPEEEPSLSATEVDCSQASQGSETVLEKRRDVKGQRFLASGADDLRGREDLLPPLMQQRVRERLSNIVAELNGPLSPITDSFMSAEAPGEEAAHYIQAAVRRMFRSLGDTKLGDVVGSFRMWRLPPGIAIMKQGASIHTGPGLCVLFDGVVDVLQQSRGSSERVCTYDRRGQCFGELQLVYDTPATSARRSHWATFATRTSVVLWSVDMSRSRGLYS